MSDDKEEHQVMCAESIMRLQTVFPSATVELDKKWEPPPKRKGSHSSCLWEKRPWARLSATLPPHLLRHSPLQLNELPSISASPQSKLMCRLLHILHTRSLVFPHPTQNLHYVLLYMGCLSAWSCRTETPKPRPTMTGLWWSSPCNPCYMLCNP